MTFEMRFPLRGLVGSAASMIILLIFLMPFLSLEWYLFLTSLSDLREGGSTCGVIVRFRPTYFLFGCGGPAVYSIIILTSWSISPPLGADLPT